MSADATGTRHLTAEPLTAAAFAPFGDVIEAAGASFPINGGMCDRFHDLARIEVVGDGRIGRQRRRQPALCAAARLHAGRASSARQPGLRADERGSVPRGRRARRGRPSRTPRAFLTRPGQGVNYLRNIWHGVLTPLGRPARFLIVDRIGSGNNLEEYTYDQPWSVVS